MGKALANLHEVPPHLVEHAGFASHSAQEIRQQWQEKIDDAATSGHIPPALLQRWEEALEDVAWWRFRPTTIHGDLEPADLHVNVDHVLAMSDFSKVEVADPAQDLSWIIAGCQWETAQRVLAAYHLNRAEGADPYLRQRGELYGELALVSWLQYGLSTQNQAVVLDAAQMLQELYEQVGDSSLSGQPLGSNTEE